MNSNLILAKGREKKLMYTWFVIGFIFLMLVGLVGFRQMTNMNQPKQWEFQSIDTMKYSRDMNSDRLNDPTYAGEVDKQVSDIAKTGATHVAIGTPYDDEFLPILTLWVRAARRHHLKVWFRGNWSGWEQWHGYGKIDEQEHIDKTKEFILNNKSLFQNGDVFTSCTECENGAQLDANNQDAVRKHREFLIEEYTVAKQAFATVHKDVKANYYSMNDTVALAVMDKETTTNLDGVVVIDHYVKSPEQLLQDIKDIAQRSGGIVILGELGAPIPGINDAMTVEQQKQWLQTVLSGVAQIEAVQGVNYWVNKGGSTALWEDNGRPKPAVDVLSKAYHGEMK